MTQNTDMADLDKDLDLCARHIRESGNTNTRLGCLFAGFALGLIYGVYQRSIRTSVIRRTRNCHDVDVVKYVEHSLRYSNMSLRTIESNIFDIFGEGHSPKVNALVTEAARKEYRQLINARNKAMHGEDRRKSLDEGIRMHHVAKGVVYVAVEVLSGEDDSIFDNPAEYGPLR
jgi:hypothetical protein